MEKFCEKPTYIRIFAMFKNNIPKVPVYFVISDLKNELLGCVKKTLQKKSERRPIFGLVFLIFCFKIVLQQGSYKNSLFFTTSFLVSSKIKKVLFHSWYSQILSLSKIWKAVKVVFFKSIQILIFLLRSCHSVEIS